MEQRRHSRTPLVVHLNFAQNAESERVSAISRDISLGGIFIETPSPAKFGSTVVIYLQLPRENREFSLAAVVRWTNAEGMGLQFAPMGVHETRAIMNVTT